VCVCVTQRYSLVYETRSKFSYWRQTEGFKKDRNVFVPSGVMPVVAFSRLKTKDSRK